jgi:hypothetical protein
MMKQNRTNNFASLMILALILTSSSLLASLSVGWQTSVATTITDSSEGEEPQRQPVEIISTIRNLLNHTIDEYKKQNYTSAGNLADIAYIDNFEFVEAPLAEKDEELMVETEITLREKLSRLIEERVPVEQVQQLVDQINKQLDQEQNFPFFNQIYFSC